jgi:hypothetical protein
MESGGAPGDSVPPFRRTFFASDAPITRIGEGAVGGKAQGLVRAQAALSRLELDELAGVRVAVPRMTVLATRCFEAFMDRNALWDVALSGEPDDRIAHAFQRADLPAEVVGDLRALTDEVRVPLAVRSSSLLEDRLAEPFAGVYVTKMIPNHQPDPSVRARRLTEAVKLVYASTWFRAAKSYARATGHDIRDERMAVILQEVVGRRHEDRFYPDVSGVARSFNFYPFGSAAREEGVVHLALGLGKSIVDGEPTWWYSPRHPKAPPPFASVADRMKRTQLRFWAVHMGRAPEYDPVRETEYLTRADLSAAEFDGTLDRVASTWDERSDRLVPGTGIPGPRVLDFAPVLTAGDCPLNDAIRRLLQAGEASLERPVEIEFALRFGGLAESDIRFAFLQMRGLVAASGSELLEERELDAAGALVASRQAMGNGSWKDIRDVVYLPPDRFQRSETARIAREVSEIDDRLAGEGRGYVLIGFGRWGTTDPWLGVPVTWPDISGAKVIVEAALDDLVADPSQGSHFFHNVSSLGVAYLHVRPGVDKSPDWTWLSRRKAAAETAFVRHVRLDEPLSVRVDGRRGWGIVGRETERGDAT